MDHLRFVRRKESRQDVFITVFEIKTLVFPHFLVIEDFSSDLKLSSAIHVLVRGFVSARDEDILVKTWCLFVGYLLRNL